MQGIKFYSENDMAYGWEMEKIVERVNTNAIESNWSITDLLDFYNILKYINIERFRNYIVQETSIDIETYIQKIKQKIGRFVGHQGIEFVNLYGEIDYDYTDDFLEVFENYKLYKRIDINNFKQFLERKDVHIYSILKFKRLTEYYDKAVKDILLSDPRNAEVILSKYLKEDQLYLPPSMTESDKLNLIDLYIDSELVDINELRKIINFPTNKGLIISDKIRLHAKRKAKEEEEKIFKNGVGIESGVNITYLNDQDEAVLYSMDGRTADIKFSRKWIEENVDYPTLWNNFIYLFGFVDENMRLELDSKKSQSSALESVIRSQADHLYFQSSSFRLKEMLSNAEIYSYANELDAIGIRLEEMIEWFFNVYLKEEFSIDNFVVKMPSSEATYFEKCRTILPEIDRIFKQYNTLTEDGMIDQELIQMSSSSFKIKDIRSFNKKKYVYSLSDWYKKASYLLFSDQSGIFYLPNKKGKKYNNFFNLISTEKLTRDDFHENQLIRMQWLFENNLICESNKGNIEFVDRMVIIVLKELYYKEVMSYWNYPKDIQILIDELSRRGLVDFETGLFSRNEQDYLDYYLNKSKFTNGHDIRNKYLHGTNTNDEKQYEIDYYLILKLFVIIVIKINDDLCIKENNAQQDSK
ncbi:hypothetical protein M3182_04335 [Mesobacillus maritimus]|uniref:hypothetical protein n=1 Tax=Mesobacillus maritimus TaxID=1643336 RepID=UPI00203D0431|nr:hypothetical protein [Mesobacillus maritimus]MCM3584974.1 hypothetical protein [Mesobacillus maritimus]